MSIEAKKKKRLKKGAKAPFSKYHQIRPAGESKEEMDIVLGSFQFLHHLQEQKGLILCSPEKMPVLNNRIP